MQRRKRLAKTIQDLFSRADRWTRFAYARAEAKPKGRITNEDGPEGVCFCLAGAISHIYSSNRREKIYDKILTVIKLERPKEEFIEAWNDRRGRTIQDVRRIVKKVGV